MNDLTTLSYLMLHNKGVYCLFLGSGISRKAGIPTGWEIITDQIGKIAALQQEEIAGTPEEWYFNKYQKLPDYSDILELLTNTPAERVNALKAYFEPNAEELEEGLKTPTIAHREIAKLIKSGIVKVVVTTNFDRLLEHALNDEGIEPVVISNPTHVENTQPIVHNPITIVKVNGDYLDTRFLNIKSELTGYDPRIERLLSEIFENFGLITCGWSAAWDIALVDLLKAANKFRYSNYFTYRGTPSPELAELAVFRQGYLQAINDADSFFKSMGDQIEAFTLLQSRHPLTKELSLARLKKLIAKEENRVALFDLLSMESKRTFDVLNTREFPQPSAEALKSELNIALAQLDIISTLLVNGIYWGKSYHDTLWLQTFTRFLYPTDKSNSWSLWSQFQRFPEFYLFNVIGTSAVIAGNFALLRELLYSTRYTRFNAPKEQVILEFSPEDIIEGQLLKKLLGNNDYTPMSDLMMKTIRPYFAEYFAHTGSFEDQFDYFEYCFALVYVSISEENWFPLGRFAWRLKRSRSGLTYVQEKIKTAEKQQENFELIGTLFDNYTEYAAANKRVWDFITGINFV